MRVYLFRPFVFERDLPPAMAHKPAPVIVRLINRDPVDPGAQTALFAETIHTAKNFEEHILNHIARVILVAQQTKNHRIDRLFIALDQLFIGFSMPARKPRRMRASSWETPLCAPARIDRLPEFAR